MQGAADLEPLLAEIASCIGGEGSFIKGEADPELEKVRCWISYLLFVSCLGHKGTMRASPNVSGTACQGQHPVQKTMCRI